jgi:hypothetical protein
MHERPGDKITKPQAVRILIDAWISITNTTLMSACKMCEEDVFRDDEWTDADLVEEI